MKIIAIIGGGCSEIGKSYIGASIGYLLKENGIDVDIVKFDGYLNLHISFFISLPWKRTSF